MYCFFLKTLLFQVCTVCSCLPINGELRRVVSHVADYMMLSAELYGCGGDFSESDFPEKVIFDYVRVYKKDDDK